MRLGAPLARTFTTPDEWIAALTDRGYTAAYCPVDPGADPAAVAAYAAAARDADIVIAEVGAWSNPISPDETTRSQALDTCRKALALAEAIGANCCVNIAGSRGPKWDGHHPDNLTDETFEMIVQTVRAIIDDVTPTRAFYTLETMPWMFPDSTDCYLRLIDAIDREQFAVHFDPVNLVC
ncbi:MAG: sugar phosphate isomerase/epimerase family protein, partial [Planctomycetota bacterium]